MVYWPQWAMIYYLQWEHMAEVAYIIAARK